MDFADRPLLMLQSYSLITHLLRSCLQRARFVDQNSAVKDSKPIVVANGTVIDMSTTF